MSLFLFDFIRSTTLAHIKLTTHVHPCTTFNAVLHNSLNVFLHLDLFEFFVSNKFHCFLLICMYISLVCCLILVVTGPKQIQNKTNKQKKSCDKRCGLLFTKPNLLCIRVSVVYVLLSHVLQKTCAKMTHAPNEVCEC